MTPRLSDCTFRPFVGEVLEVMDTNVLRVALASEVLHLTHEHGKGMKTVGHHDEPVAVREIRIAGIGPCVAAAECPHYREEMKAWFAGRRMRFEVPSKIWSTPGSLQIAAVVLDESGKTSINAEVIRRGWAAAQNEEPCLLERLEATAASPEASPRR